MLTPSKHAESFPNYFPNIFRLWASPSPPLPLILSRDYFHVENYCFWHISLSYEGVCEEGKTALAQVMKLVFNRLAVPLNKFKMLRTFIFFFILNGRDSPPSSSS